MPPFKYLNLNNKLPSVEIPIYELGCHDGKMLEPFYRHGYYVVGVDKDSEAIERAKVNMPKGIFVVHDIRDFTVPENGFVIIRNVFSFFDTKEQVEQLLLKIRNHKIFFTMFGPNDELAPDKLTWTREEIEKICSKVGATIVSEFDGMGTNMAGNPRRSHCFTCVN